MNSSIEKIAKILRTDKDFILKVEKRLSAVSGKEKVMEKIVAENEERVKNCLLKLGVSSQANAFEVYDALISKVEADDNLFFETLHQPNCSYSENCWRILELIQKVSNVERGFFIKKEKALELLQQEPPKEIMSFLGYNSVVEMLEKEDIFEIFSALRFVEGSDWLNNVFFKHYKNLKPTDFEEREIIVKVLNQKWNKAAEKFVMKKWHNISHLKELGVIFVIPVNLGISGELLRMISLVFHYFHEISFYSEIFKKICNNPTTFADNLVSILRGDVLDKRLAENEKSLWLVVQRYLAKEDENEWRLFVPHVNPEAVHWSKATRDIVKLGKFLDGFEEKLSFWVDLDWVGDYFKDEIGREVLVSFNLVDTVMSLVKEKEMIKYLYHQQEAFWNKIFEEYFGREQLERFCKDYLLQGYFEI